MNNIKAHMKEKSLFIVTSFLEQKIKNSFFEKSRDLNSYKQIFNTENFSEPKKFRDKFIFIVQGS